MEKLQSFYYQLSHLWKGHKAIRKLKEFSKEKLKVIKQWLARQAFWQVHSPLPKCVDRPHYKVMIPKEMHQFDLLYVNKYEKILSGIDVASIYKVARPLRMNQAKEVTDMISVIYKVDPLTYPKIFQCDNGSESKAEVPKVLEK